VVEAGMTWTLAMIIRIGLPIVVALVVFFISMMLALWIGGLAESIVETVDNALS
jgi:hypothetical protein